MAAKNRVTVNLEDREYKKLSVLSSEYHVSLAWLGRLAIIRLLEHSEKEEQQLSLSLPSEAPKSGS